MIPVASSVSYSAIETGGSNWASFATSDRYKWPVLSVLSPVLIEVVGEIRWDAASMSVWRKKCFPPNCNKYSKMSWKETRFFTIVRGKEDMTRAVITAENVSRNEEQLQPFGCWWEEKVGQWWPGVAEGFGRKGAWINVLCGLSSGVIEDNCYSEIHCKKALKVHILSAKYTGSARMYHFWDGCSQGQNWYIYIYSPAVIDQIWKTGKRCCC